MTLAEDKYPMVIWDVRKNMGLDLSDESLDAEILAMPKKKVLARYLEWNGIIGYTNTILGAVSEIYEIELEEK